MECNKEEAFRAKEIAEKKMLKDDFQGARKMALKAKNLYPEIENISQLLAVCEVHCSAQNKICSSEKDWYGILQVEKLADDATIKRQYRKLALVLHPDKNKFPGAEAAFKLIGEANRVLSDKVKRTHYDTKCRVSERPIVQKSQPHQVNPNIRNSHVDQSKFPNVSRFGNADQQTRPNFPNGGQAFWTCCPFCTTKYQYHKEYINRALRCPNCTKPFFAYDLGAHGTAPASSQANPGSEGSNLGSNRGQPPNSQQNQTSKACRMPAENSGKFPYYHFSPDVNCSRKMGSEQVTRTENTTGDAGGLNNKVPGNAYVNTDDRNIGVRMSKFDGAKGRESGSSRNKNGKRRRKCVNDSSDSCNSLSSSHNEESFEETRNDYDARQNSMPDTFHRRSSRLKKNVSYNENAADDDFICPLKRSRESKFWNDEEKQKEPFNTMESKPAEINKKEIKSNVCKFTEGSLLNNCNDVLKHKVNVEEAVKMDKSTSDPELYICPDPEFNDFDKDKDEKCFSVDQIWACYDTIDGMPRFYAQVKKVFSAGFKLRITWLEANLEEQGEIDWVSEGLPVGCGKFVRGETEETSDRLTFSHQIHFVKGSTRGSYVIHPRRGETWALFRDWDIGWSSDPENHKKYVFEIVEILSEFGHDTGGIKVGYLSKVKGFASLFQRTKRGGNCTFLIPYNELLRFSHRIPSFEMTGDEREGVPEGSYELDPASLPTNPNEIWSPEELKVETLSMNDKVTCSSSKFFDDKSVTRSESMSTCCTPKKSVELEGKNCFEKEAVKLRRSPRELNNSNKKSVHVYSSPFLSGKGVVSSLDGSKTQSGVFIPSKSKVKSGQASEDIHREMVRSPIDLTESPGVNPSLTSDAKVSEEVFYDFNLDKSGNKFQRGQIWALYSTKDSLPNNYGLIKKIETSPLKLHVTFLEPCTFNQPICCGSFKIPNVKPKIFQPNSFSHLMKGEFIDKEKLEIYPKEGEIWVIYKNRDAELSCPGLENVEFEIVQVLKSTENLTVVSCLTLLPGFKSVYKAQRRQRSNTAVLTICREDLFRFSHQVPAFKLTGEKDGYLRGCWELDLAALPDHMFHKQDR